MAVACSSCGFTNEPGEKFCGGCGQALKVAAAAVPAPKFASPQTYTPKHLAEKILTSKSALEGERLASKGAEKLRKRLFGSKESTSPEEYAPKSPVDHLIRMGLEGLFGC